MRIAGLTFASFHASLLSFALAVPAATADDNQAAFNNHCRTCHSTKEGDNRLGPSLYKIFGAKAGAVPGYASYSQGLSSSGITWDEVTLREFIANPDTVIPSNNMKPYKGIADEAVRQKIIEFLKSDRE
jgi:cytochrome c